MKLEQFFSLELCNVKKCYGSHYVAKTYLLHTQFVLSPFWKYAVKFDTFRKTTTGMYFSVILTYFKDYLIKQICSYMNIFVKSYVLHAQV